MKQRFEIIKFSFHRPGLISTCLGKVIISAHTAHGLMYDQGLSKMHKGSKSRGWDHCFFPKILGRGSWGDPVHVLHFYCALCVTLIPSPLPLLPPPSCLYEPSQRNGCKCKEEIKENVIFFLEMSDNNSSS